MVVVGEDHFKELKNFEKNMDARKYVPKFPSFLKLNYYNS